MPQPSVVSLSAGGDFLPAAYRVADATASVARRRSMALIVWNLALVFAVAVVASVYIPGDEVRRAQALVGVGAFGLSLLLSIVTSSLKYDRTWLKSRAIAEQIKSAAWRFAVFPSEPAAVAETAFLGHLEKTVKDVPVPLAKPPGDSREITYAMLALRGGTLVERRDAYLAGRLEDQRDWFAKKAASQSRAGRAWSYTLYAAQGVGFVSSLVSVAYPSAPFSGRAICSAIGAASLGWLRATQHRDVAAAYATTSQALGILIERGRRTRTESEFGALVDAAETLLANENATWLTRRSVE